MALHKLDELFTVAESIGATDLHLIEGEKPVFRISRSCLPAPEQFREEVLTNWESIKERVRILSQGISLYGPGSVNYTQVQETQFKAKHTSFDWKEWRIRMVAYRTSNREAFAFRFQTKEVMPLAKLGLDNDALNALRDVQPGLILISGGACAGKTTTLHSLVDWLNKTHGLHIRTLEAPIEYVHHSDKSLVTQQSVGDHQDADSYYQAVEDALVHDVNVVVFGEIKDLATLKAALKAANLNLLVLATIHAPSVAWTIARAIDEFPESDRREATLSLSRALKMVVFQKLVMTRTPVPGQQRVSIGTKMVYRAAHFAKDNNLRVFISPEKIFDLDEKFFFKPLEKGLFQHPEFDKQVLA